MKNLLAIAAIATLMTVGDAKRIPFEKRKSAYGLM